VSAPDDPPASSPPASAPAAAEAVPDRGVRFLAVNAAAVAAAGLIALASSSLPLPGRARAPSIARAGTFLDPSWDDEKAEVSRYAATRTIYGRPESYELIQVVVKEPFDPATRTKPDGQRAGVVDALKLVQVHDIGTKKAYRYRQTLVARVERADPARLLDASVTSMEWCGNTFALVTPRGTGFLRHAHSYFDGEGDRDEALPAGTWLEDQLAVALRAMPLELGATLEVLLLPTLVSNRQPAVAPAPAKLVVEADEDVQGRRCARVAIGGSRWWIGRDAPRPLVKATHPDGRSLELRSIERAAYWVEPK
jgi:hypothetical protein